MSRTPACEDSATIAERLREIQAERMAAIAGCGCPQRDTNGGIVHTPLCPLRAEPASQMEMAREAIQRARSRARLAQHALPLCLAMALVYDPHLLVLSWGDHRQETVAATSRATCEAAADAIREGRWLGDDPPVAMACRQGNGFSERSLCIPRFNCREGAR